MNYEPVSVENQANKSASLKEANHSVGTQANDDQGANSKEVDLHDEHFILRIWSAYSTIEELKKLKRQEKEANDAAKTEATHENQDANTNNTNLLNVVSAPISTASPSKVLNDDVPSYPDNPSMPHLEDIYANPSKGIFTDSSYDDEGVVTDFNNFETTVNVSPTPIPRIHTIHPKTQILRDPLSDVQTRNFPFGKKAFRTKCIYRNKKDETGVVVRNKAILVAQGHREEERIDYDESAFLYGTIDEEVYVIQPPSFEDPKFLNKVYKAVKALYGLYKLLELVMLLCLLSWRKVKQKEDGIFIYVAKILKKFDFLSVKTASTSIETQKPLVKDEEAADMDAHLYRSMIGFLMYLTTSRPDLIFAVYDCSRFQVTPKTSHLQVVKRIFRYLKGQPKSGLWYPKVSSFNLETYSDSDYAGVNLDRKSKTGGCQFLGRRLILWQCKKQTIVATSNIEAEYIAAAYCCGQVL
uniref:Uncharacterized protein n=1 Tax=Tanacetum cinerariifolium TaxID=118510 RepID=A0A699H3D6_TANCI|nr:hypothetical protein [Tanacetum cinerariifolium]